MITMMLRTTFAILIMCSSMPGYAQQAVEIAAQAKQHERLKIKVVVLSKDDTLDQLLAIFKKSLEFTGQFALELQHAQQPLDAARLKQLWHEGYPFVVYLDYQDHALLVRLYETHTGTMVLGKMIQKQPALRALAYRAADVIWPVLTGLPGFFSTKIAYSKQIQKDKFTLHQHICIADYDGSHEQVLVDSPTINVAPRWNRDPLCPLLFYAQSTNTNIRLMATDMKKLHKIASNFDGLNMLPSFAADGKTLVYCASRGDGSTQLYFYTKGAFKKLTNNAGNNISPSVSDDGRWVYYCSDAGRKSPQILKMELATQAIEPVVTNGFCVCPTYHQPSNRLAYCRMVNGLNQLFVYDMHVNQHTQLTFDDTDKDECHWSVCGSYVLFASQRANKSRIAMINTRTHKVNYLTDAINNCSYPAWSGAYAVYPIVHEAT